MNTSQHEKCDKIMTLLMNTGMDKWHLLSKIKNESERDEDNIYLLDKLVEDGYIKKHAFAGYSNYSLTSNGKLFISEGGYSGKIKAEKEKQEQERLLKEKTIEAHSMSIQANKAVVKDRTLRNISFLVGILGVIIAAALGLSKCNSNFVPEKKEYTQPFPQLQPYPKNSAESLIKVLPLQDSLLKCD